MGCDIHLFIEKRDKGSKKWVRVNKTLPVDTEKDICYCDNLDDDEELCSCCKDSSIHIPRCYALFTILAGVRDYDYKPISEPRGLPKDISEELKDCIYDHAEHSFSYHTLHVLKKYKWEYDFDVFSDIVMPMLEKIAEEVGDKNVRIVFGFDN